MNKAASFNACRNPADLWATGVAVDIHVKTEGRGAEMLAKAMSMPAELSKYTGDGGRPHGGSPAGKTSGLDPSSIRPLNILMASVAVVRGPHGCGPMMRALTLR